jgi:hypothetical protein
LNSFRLLSLTAFAAFVFVTSSPAQNVTIVSGNGQILGTPQYFFLQPLIVQVTDPTTGAPVGSGVQVNWQSSGFNGVFLANNSNQVTLATDANGQSTAIFSLASNTPTFDVTTPFIQTTVTATAVTTAGTASAGTAATFTLTQLANAPTISIAPFIIVVQDPNGTGNGIPLSSTLKGAIGTTAPPIQLRVGASNGQSTKVLPNVAVELLNFQDPTQGPVVSCASPPSPTGGQNAAFTDINGLVSCTPVFAGQPGQGQFFVTIGGIQNVNVSPAGFFLNLLDPTDLSSLPTVQTPWQTFPPTIKINATAGAPGSIKIVAPTGGTQSVTAGGAVNLTVEADNSAGLGLSGSTINWKIVSPAAGANLSNGTTTTGQSGQSINTVTISNGFAGVVTVTATLGSDPTKSVTFTINVSPPVTISQFTIVSGNNQSAVANNPFAQPLVVKASTSAGSSANIPVQFSVLSGSAFLSATTVTTDSNGLAQVSITAGSITGPVSVLAAVPSSVACSNICSISFALTVIGAAPTITAANFVNGADQQANSLSPCSLGAVVTNAGTLAVSNVSPTFPGTPIPSSPVQLTFANIAAPILNIGSTPIGQQQILFQVPCEVLPGSSVPVTLSVGGAVANLNLNLPNADV